MNVESCWSHRPENHPFPTPAEGRQLLAILDKLEALDEELTKFETCMMN